jgi:putative ABC transport system permease protein
VRGIPFRRRAASRRERAQELQAHLEMETGDNIARGMASDEARRAAHLKLGSTTGILERIDDLERVPWVDGTWTDVRLALRGFARTPAVSLLMVATLALGIGATTAIFSVMNVLLLRPIAGVRDEARLASLEREPGQGIVDIFSYPEYRDLRDRTRSIDLAAFRRTTLDVRSGGTASARVRGDLVTGNYFPVLGVQAEAGRLLDRGDAHADVAVVSDACWKTRFGGDPGIVGRSLTINGRAFVIVGVTAQGFDGTYPGQRDDVWVPLDAQPIVMPRMSAGVMDNRDSRWLQVVGRLAPGVSAAAAGAEVDAAGQALARLFPSSHGGRLLLQRGLGLASDDRGEMRGFLGLLFAGACLLLFVACGNVGNLILARADTRRRDVATRRALGASQGRIARQMLIEGLLLAMAGGGVGLWLAPRIILAVGALSESAYGIGAPALAPDLRVLVFALLVSVSVAVGFTAAPLLHVRRASLVDALRESARGAAGRTTRLRQSLVVAQVALSVTILIGAGLSWRTMQRIHAVAPGYATNGVVLASYALDLQGYPAPAAARFFERLSASLAAVPGVRAVTWATAIAPVEFGGRRSVFHVGEAPPQAELQRREEELGIRADVTFVGPAFFETMGIAIARGRGFTGRDRAGTQAVAVVNEALAERLWPGEDAIGRDLEAPPFSGPGLGPMEVVGLARDTRHRSLLSATPVPVLYLPFLQTPDQRATLALRSAAGAAALDAQIRQRTAALDPNVAVAAVQDLDQYVAGTLWEQRTAEGLFGTFGLLGLFLAASGLYAMVSHAVAMRTREMGIRVALGASTSGVVRLVVSHGLRLAAAGAAIGVLIAIAMGGAMRHILFDVNPRDLVTFTAAPLVVLLVALAASVVPARRAALADPSRALRQE